MEHRPPYEVLVTSEAVRAYQRLHEPLLSRIEGAIDALALNPRPPGTSALAGRDDFRIRVGDYRIVYSVDDARREILISRLPHRREVYR